MIEVLRPGVFTTVQDTGRYGAQKLGVPVGGAMDSFAVRVANLLVGNAGNAAALEVTLGGLSLHLREEALIAVTGATTPILVNDRPVPAWRPVRVMPGSTVKVGRPTSGCRAYLAVAGGLDVPLVLNGRGTYVRAAFGGHEGRPLKQGDELRAGPPSSTALDLLHHLRGAATPAAWTPWFVPEGLRPAYTADEPVRVMLGPEYEAFTPEAQRDFFLHSYRATPQADRMGYRLDGRDLKLQVPRELLSTAVTAGTIQVPPGGQPIVLMADAQTTGGYPRIAQVIQVDLPLIAQLVPGQTVRFQRVEADEARRALVHREHALHSLRAAIALRATTTLTGDRK